MFTKMRSSPTKIKLAVLKQLFLSRQFNCFGTDLKFMRHP